MKKTIVLIPLFLVMITFLFYNCEGDESVERVEITYPDSGYYGINILNMIDSIYHFDPGPGYGDDYPNSMKAILPSDSKLRVEIKGAQIAVYQIQGWFTNADIFQYQPDNYNYDFAAEGPISADLRIFFCGNAHAIINIYENGDSIPTRIKHLKFQN